MLWTSFSATGQAIRISRPTRLRWRLTAIRRQNSVRKSMLLAERGRVWLMCAVSSTACIILWHALMMRTAGLRLLHGMPLLRKRRARAIKDARIAFEPLVAAQLREEAQEKANRANIEATNAARQKQVQLLREQAEAMMRNKLASLESQKRAMGQLYIQGKSLGLDPAELETILSRYRELAREVLNFQTMMQNPSSMSYNSMFSMGRFSGVGANYVREASEQVSALRTRTQEAAYAARDLAAAFDRVHSSASRSSQVLSDIKSLSSCRVE